MLIYNWIITDFFSSTDVICENLLKIINLWKSVDYFTTDVICENLLKIINLWKSVDYFTTD